MPIVQHVVRSSAASSSTPQPRESEPLLPSYNNQDIHQHRANRSKNRDPSLHADPHDEQRNQQNPDDQGQEHLDFTSQLISFRETLKHFLLSKYAHYLVIVLVALDVAGIFAHFLITIHVCETTCSSGLDAIKTGSSSSYGHSYSDDYDQIDFLQDVLSGLGIVSLIISCIFMVELLLSIFAFGFSYFTSLFHIVDATSIIASFLIDVLLQGNIAEAGSLVIVLRLFRVFKIVEEGSAAAEEVGSNLAERIQMLEEENEGLRRRLMYPSDDRDVS